MKTAAGVLLITIAILNLGGAVAYSFLGRAAEVFGTVGEAVSDAGEQQSVLSGNTDGQRVAQAGKNASFLMKIMGTVVKFLGVILLGLAVAEIAAGVFIMGGNKLGFVLGASIVELLLSTLLLLTLPGPTIPLVCIAVAILAIFAVIEEKKKPAATNLEFAD